MQVCQLLLLPRKRTSLKGSQHLLEHFREERQCQNHLSEYRSAYKYLSTERNRHQRCVQCCTKRYDGFPNLRSGQHYRTPRLRFPTGRYCQCSRRQCQWHYAQRTDECCRRKANGIQFSGLGNIAGNISRGVTIGGLMNLAGNKAQGVQIAGLANIAGKSQMVSLSADL